ncbi:membrane-spanning 4-domains subfamily A member 8-like [Alligator mississippiensis]|uniref:Membrane-spanning 4-domains subfamily A member 8-like n=1 Tax=Alligator mississippiensis TaxID=8496 RepID=A0A151NY76_ALLMI|nr:membrane-spanning 4-domains subfamily A member 8-like [Alligator mississippiensis]
MYTVETVPKGKNRVMGTIQIMTGFMHIGFGIVLTTLTNVYSSLFVVGEIPFLGGVSFIISGCLSIGAEKSPTECAVKGSQTMNVISAIFALLGITSFIIDLNLNGLYRSEFDYYNYLVMAGNGISIVLLIFTILEFCIAVATAHFWCRATRANSNEAMLIVPNAVRADPLVPTTELLQPPNYNEFWIFGYFTWEPGALDKTLQPDQPVKLRLQHFAVSLLITMAEVMDNSGGQHFVQVPQAMISSANNQPVVMIQPSAIPMQTVQLGNQQLVTLSPVNQSPQILENYLKAEHKALGIVQIMIGLIHIGSGMVFALGSYFISLALVSGYVFWGGLLFIASGSLSVASEKNPIDCHMKGSLGMNIISAIAAIVGLILMIADVSIRSMPYNESYFLLMSTEGITAMLIIFSILELVVAIRVTHFGYQIFCCQPRAPFIIQNSCLTVAVPPPEASPPPPYNYSASNPRNLAK